MARSRTPDGADHHATFFAFIDELLEGLDRRILFHAKLPAHHAPSVDRDKVARLVARPPDYLVDRSAGRGLRHHHVTVRPGGMQFAARDASARPQDIVEARLHSLLLEIGLDDARGRVYRATGRLIDDPADVTGGKRLLSPRRGRQFAKPRRSGNAECGAPRVAQETAPIDPHSAAHIVLPQLLSAPSAATCRALCRAHVDIKSVPAPRPATRDRWCGSESARRRARGPSSRPTPIHGSRHAAARARTGLTRSSV